MKNIVNHAQYLRPGEFLYIQGPVEINWRKKKEIKENPDLNPTPEDWELATNSISLLTELREKRGTGIQVKIDAQTVNDKLIENILALAEQHHGEKNLKVEIFDELEGISVNLFSRNLKIDPSNELIRELKNITENAYLITS